MRLTKEESLTIACANYLRSQYPEILFCHIANERNTSRIRGGMLKKMGVRKGMPDLMIFKPMGVFVGLAVELKISPNKPTKEQLQVLDRLTVNEWYSDVLYDYVDDFIILAKNYLNPRSEWHEIQKKLKTKNS